MGEHLGPARMHRILLAFSDITGSDRYRPSLWSRRRAQLRLPLHFSEGGAA
jgi:3-hydroxybutyryl-CoA dehydrogenase